MRCKGQIHRNSFEIFVAFAKLEGQPCNLATLTLKTNTSHITTKDYLFYYESINLYTVERQNLPTRTKYGRMTVYTIRLTPLGRELLNAIQNPNNSVKELQEQA